jgi:hypothetical protein
VPSDDPEEVEATQGIERKQTVRLRGRSLHGGEAFLATPNRRSTWKRQRRRANKATKDQGAPRTIGTSESPTTPGEINRHIRPNMSILMFLVDI